MKHLQKIEALEKRNGELVEQLTAPKNELATGHRTTCGDNFHSPIGLGKCHVLHVYNDKGKNICLYKYWRRTKKRWEYGAEPLEPIKDLISGHRNEYEH